jgi:O-acetyl-ADP-ribose deacetylase (regulator of RNase III)
MAPGTRKQNSERRANLILMKTKLAVIKGDITQIRADAIVNAANTSLLGGGGVDGAIHRAGGPSILQECIKIRDIQGGCPVGEAVVTTAGLLKAKYVIHTVGPIWNGGRTQERQLLANCYRNSLLIAVQYNIGSIAFPNISTGVYHFPKKEAADIAISEVKKFISYNQTIESILFVCFDDENYSIYESLLAAHNSID